MMVAFPINSEQLEVRAFGCFTRDLHSISVCLKENGITSIAMESTGVFWISLFLLLQEQGFEVILVNAKLVKNVTGRKDDESDAEWIQKLHSCGLLKASFPLAEIFAVPIILNTTFVGITKIRFRVGKGGYSRPFDYSY